MAAPITAIAILPLETGNSSNELDKGVSACQDVVFGTFELGDGRDVTVDLVLR